MRSPPVSVVTVVSHLLQALRHAVAGARQIAHAAAASRELEGDGLQAGRRLEQLERDVVVLDHDALVAVITVPDPALVR